jgi:hypothetical protein
VVASEAEAAAAGLIVCLCTTWYCNTYIIRQYVLSVLRHNEDPCSGVVLTSIAYV